MASLVDARTATVNQKRHLCPLVSIKTLFALMTGVCLLGIFILTFYTRLGDLSPKWVYDTVSNLKGYRDMDVLTFIWNRSSIVGQSSDRRLPLVSTTSDRRLPLVDMTSDRRLPLAVKASDRRLPLADMYSDRRLPLSDMASDRTLPLVDTARDKRLPLADMSSDRELPLVDTASDRRLPLTDTTSDRRLPLDDTTSDRRLPLTDMSSDRRLPLADTASDRRLPLADMSSDRRLPFVDTASDRRLPLADTTSDRRLPLTDMSSDRRLPLADTTSDRRLPLADKSNDRRLPLADTTSDRRLPLADTTSERRLPLADTTSDRRLPLADTTSDRRLPLADMSSDIKLPLADMSSDIKLPLADMSSDIKLPLADMSSDIKLPLADMTNAGLPLTHQLRNMPVKGNISAIPATKSSGIHRDQTMTRGPVRTRTLAKVHPITTTMTFNKSLEVRCKESPYIECAPPVVRTRTEKVFKVAFINQPNWYPLSSANVDGCRYSRCQFVENIITEETDLVVVNGIDIEANFEPRESWRRKLVALCGWEPPVYTKSHLPAMTNSPWNNRFNLTMTYRLDSDIFSPYSRIKFKPKPLWKRPNYHEIAKKKTKTVVWVVSHCRTYSKRERYVRWMKKHVDVDILGSCGEPCSTTGVNCDDISSDYKFYLSFENTLCDDYITEKFFKLFRPGMHVIPVVRGGADYDKYFPNFTYINAAHFKRPKDLALHLKKLASDLETYSKYLEYKDLYAISVPGIEMVCNICEYLHTRKRSEPKTYSLKSWMENGHCHNPTDV